MNEHPRREIGEGPATILYEVDDNCLRRACILVTEATRDQKLDSMLAYEEPTRLNALDARVLCYLTHSSERS